MTLIAFGVVAGFDREVDVAIWTVAPPVVKGRLVSFSLRDGAVVRAGAEKRVIPTADIIRIVRDAPASPGVAAETARQVERDGWKFTLTWADVLTGRVVETRGESVVIETDDFGEVPVPIEAVAALASGKRATGGHRESVEWLERGYAAAKQEGSDEDRVLLTNGDMLAGFIRSIDAGGIAIDTATGSTAAPLRLVVAARLTHLPATAPPLPHLILSLRGGARLTATGLEEVDEGVTTAPDPGQPRWAVTLRTGATVHVGTDRLVALEVIGGRWEWLSDHRPVSYEQTPMLGPGWDYVADRCVSGGPIQVAGKQYDRGIGVHSRSKLVFELNGRYREFVTSFGIDDDSGPLADVTVLILVDGQRRFEKAYVRRGTLSGPVRIEVSHAGRIELLVDYGENGDLQDRFDWVEPGLIR